MPASDRHWEPLIEQRIYKKNEVVSIEKEKVECIEPLTAKQKLFVINDFCVHIFPSPHSAHVDFSSISVTRTSSLKVIFLVSYIRNGSGANRIPYYPRTVVYNGSIVLNLCRAHVNVKLSWNDMKCTIYVTDELGCVANAKERNKM